MPAQPGRWHVDFTIPSLPPIVGPVEIAVSISASGTERVLAARTFVDAFACPGERAHGLLDTPWQVALSGGEPTPDTGQAAGAEIPAALAGPDVPTVPAYGESGLTLQPETTTPTDPTTVA